MIPFSEAYSTVMKHSLEFENESVPLLEAVGRFLAEPVASPIDSPPFDKSAMDGFAIMPKDESGEFEILETVAAGDKPQERLKPGSCIKIMTGAMLPEETGRVVRVEYTAEEAGRMRITTPEPYENIIRRGENLKSGDEFMPVKRLGPGDIGSLAASGISRVMVKRRLRTAIITTGSELKEPGEPLAPGEIYNSNGYQLACQIEAAGGEAVSYGIVADDPELHAKVIRGALEECDIVLLSGGVSKGEFDYVPDTLREAGVEILIHGVKVKPGRPTLFGRGENVFVFGLPGNPVSTFILFEVLVKPFIYHLNSVPFRPPVMQGRLSQEIKRRDTERMEFRPVKLRHSDGPFDGIEATEARLIDPVRYMGSAHLNAMVETEGLILMQPGVERIEEGSIVDVRLI